MAVDVGEIQARRPSGLLDEEGYFYRNQDLWRSLDPKAARIEMEAQVDRSLAGSLVEMGPER